MQKFMSSQIILEQKIIGQNIRYLQFMSSFTEVDTGTEMLLLAAYKVKYIDKKLDLFS